ncbi:hypothetical protein [Kitasatospora sp. NPDC057015]|uniref:hypothetical protein n=1 Tax=Kitasatospora sp. NPDC057015 TaxID=3346001 RepID=UPI00362B58EC
MTETSAPMQSLTFAAWREVGDRTAGHVARRYVTLAELLVRLGSFGLDLTWKVRTDHPRLDAACAVLESTSTGTGIGTPELLALAAPDLQTVDGDFKGYSAGELVVILREFDSTSWDVCTADERLLREIRENYPDAEPTPPGEWDL